MKTYESEWTFEGLEDLPVPRWTDDELDAAYSELSSGIIAPCSDGLGHAFVGGSGDDPVALALCGRYVFPLHVPGAVPMAFCAHCVARKSPN